MPPNGRRPGLRVGAAVPRLPEINKAKTKCDHGHLFDAGNTYRYPGGVGRGCRVCRREAQRRYKARKRAGEV